MDPEALNKLKEQTRFSREDRIKRKKEFSEEKIGEMALNNFIEVNPNIKLDEGLFSRLKLIERYSEINAYSRMVASGVGNLLDKNIGDERISRAKIAALIHDAGKSGPAEATQEQQIAIIKLFAKEDITKEHENETVEKMIRERFGTEAESMIMVLKDLKGYENILSWSMREFWDKHIVWGSEINEKYSKNSRGISAETIAIADLHHAYKGPDDPKYNPRRMPIDEKALKEAFTGGILEEYLSVIVFDNYEAFTNRSLSEHEQAIKQVRSVVEQKEFCSRYESICKSVNEILNKMSKMDTGGIFEGSREMI